MAVNRRTLQRTVQPYRQELKAEALARTRFETPPGRQSRTPETRHSDAVSPGVGKTQLSIALGREAILAGYKVQFTTATLVAGVCQGSWRTASGRETARLSKPKLLIVDELGYLPLEPDAASVLPSGQ
ncbi:ATP-binding protein [Bradyrhizobium canariense]|uniref:ATP-binding protein n=1 Tax=Bradyrhizobium canariense TaxID=255045 RepID=UPI001FEC28E3|nr:ATP-binding protein [Bradyrhizobium canariense]